MTLLDTDHLSLLTDASHSAYAALAARVQAATTTPVATTVVTAEEIMRGWLALVNRLQDVPKQVPAYERLAKFFDFLSRWQIVPFDAPAADQFKRLRKQKVRISTMDLKIASIALAHDALLVSANLRDFCQVPGLRVESWL